MISSKITFWLCFSIIKKKNKQNNTPTPTHPPQKKPKQRNHPQKNPKEDCYRG